MRVRPASERCSFSRRLSAHHHARSAIHLFLPAAYYRAGNRTALLCTRGQAASGPSSQAALSRAAPMSPFAIILYRAFSERVRAYCVQRPGAWQWLWYGCGWCWHVLSVVCCAVATDRMASALRFLRLPMPVSVAVLNCGPWAAGCCSYTLSLLLLLCTMPLLACLLPHCYTATATLLLLLTIHSH